MAILATSCVQKSVRPENTTSDEKPNIQSREQIQPLYAKGFQIQYTDSTILVKIQDPQQENGTSYHYCLISQKTEDVQVPEGYQLIHIPIESVVCMTSLQLSNFAKLEKTDKVVGITSTRHLFNPQIKEQLRTGHTVKIGIEGNFDNETIMAIEPDLILISPFKRGGYETLRDIGIPLIPHLGYKELTPLGQAEWIKLIGLLIGEEDKANQKFSLIEEKYNTLKSLVENHPIEKRPIVFSGELRGGNWYAVGGESFLAHLFQDAGASYFLKDNKQSGGVTLDFETVYSKADQAEYWRVVNSYPGTYNYQAIKEQDNRYSDFKAYQNKKVIYCNMREKPFYESMPTEPEIILADLLHIFHPELLPEHQPVYYDLLKE